VKPTDKPDSVHGSCPPCDHHYSGPLVTQTARCYLPANSGGPGHGAAANRLALRWPTWYCCA